MAPTAPAETAAKVPQLAKKALFTASAALESGATALAIFFLALFLAWDPDRWLRGVAELWPGPWVEERIELFRKIGVGLRSYLFTLAIYVVAMGPAWSLGLEVVPYVGPMLGLVPPLLIAMTAGPAKVHPGFWSPLWDAGGRAGCAARHGYLRLAQ